MIFNRAEESFPSLPGCLLPNVRTRTEFIGIAPDARRAGVGADPGNCKDNAIYLGLYGQPGQVIMQLPHGLIAEARVVKGLLMLSFNNPSLSQPVASPTPGSIKDLSEINSRAWAPVNHYFQYRGLTSATRYAGY